MAGIELIFAQERFRMNLYLLRNYTGMFFFVKKYMIPVVMICKTMISNWCNILHFEKERLGINLRLSLKCICSSWYHLQCNKAAGNFIVFFYTPVWKTEVLCRGNVRPSVCTSVRPSVRVFRTFLQHALRYQFETWHIHSVGGTTCRVWVAWQLGHFDLVYSQK